MQKSRFSTKKKTNLKAILLGVCLGIILHTLLSLPGAAIMNAMKNPLAAVGVVGITIRLICAVAVGFAVYKYKRESAVVTSLISSLVFFLAALPAGIISGDGGMALRSAINSAFYVIGCTGAAVLFKWFGKKRR